MAQAPGAAEEAPVERKEPKRRKTVVLDLPTGQVTPAAHVTLPTSSAAQSITTRDDSSEGSDDSRWLRGPPSMKALHRVTVLTGRRRTTVEFGTSVVVLPMQVADAAQQHEVREQAAAAVTSAQQQQQQAQDIIQDEVITEAELLNIRRIFNEFDFDHSGTIDLKELQAVMQAIGHVLTVDEAGEMIREVTGDVTCKALAFPDFLKLVVFWKDTARFKLLGMQSVAREHISSVLSTNKILSDARWRWLWDCLMLLVIGYLAGHASFLYSFDDDDEFSRHQRDFLGAEIFVSLVLLADVFIWANTAIPSGHKLECDTRTLWVEYAKMWLWLDLLPVVPLWLIVPRTAAFVLNILRLLKLPRFFVLWEPSCHIPIDPLYINFHFAMLPIISGAVCFFVGVHTAAMVLLYMDSKIRYSAAIYHTLYIFSGVGYGDVMEATRTYIEKWYACLLMLISMIINGVVIGGIVSYIQVADVSNDQRVKLRETNAVCEFFGIPEALRNEILQFQNHVLTHNLNTSFGDVVRLLPDELKLHIGIHIRLRILQRQPLFASVHEAARVAIAQCLEPIIFSPEELVSSYGDEANEMYIVVHGFLDVSDVSGTYLFTLRPDDHFGDGALLAAGKRRVANIKALTYCDLFMLTRDLFKTIASRYEHFHKLIVEAEQQRHADLVSGPKTPNVIQQLLQSMPRNGCQLEYWGVALAEAAPFSAAASETFSPCASLTTKVPKECETRAIFVAPAIITTEPSSSNKGDAGQVFGETAQPPEIEIPFAAHTIDGDASDPSSETASLTRPRKRNTTRMILEAKRRLASTTDYLGATLQGDTTSELKKSAFLSTGERAVFETRPSTNSVYREMAELHAEAVDMAQQAKAMDRVMSFTSVGSRGSITALQRSSSKVGQLPAFQFTSSMEDPPFAPSVPPVSMPTEPRHLSITSPHSIERSIASPHNIERTNTIGSATTTSSLLSDLVEQMEREMRELAEQIRQVEGLLKSAPLQGRDKRPSDSGSMPLPLISVERE